MEKWKKKTVYCLASLKLTANAPENLPGPNRKGSSSKHHFSGAFAVKLQGCTHLFSAVYKRLPKDDTKGGSYLSLDRKATQVQRVFLGLPNGHENGGSKFGVALTTSKMSCHPGFLTIASILGRGATQIISRTDPCNYTIHG